MSPAGLSVPGDKSITHRALIFAALAAGRSRIRGALESLDTRSTAACLRALGTHIADVTADEMAIPGVGLDGLRAPQGVLDCGNSGTSARLLLGLLAGSGIRAELTGDSSLRGRPMRRVTGPLSAAGARFTELGEPDRLPVRVETGRLAAIAFDAPQASAQVKSALLLAALTGRVPARLSEPWRSRDHTERMLRAAGVRCVSGTGPDGRAGLEFEPADAVEALDVTIPGDISSAAFFLAWALLHPDGAVRVRGVGVNPTRTGFLDVVRRMGGSVGREQEGDEGGEPVADLVVSHARLRGTVVEPAEIPSLVDEIPVIAALAARAEGETRIRGAGELRVKESDRLRAMAENLRAVGVEAEELPDGLVVAGSDGPLHGRIRTHADHRVAMAFGILAALPGNRIEIDRPDAAAVSFPGFWTALHGLAPSARLP